VTQAAEQTQKR